MKAKLIVVPKGYKQSDVGVIPGDWNVKPVGSMGEVRAGKALAARGPGTQRPYLRTKNVFDGRIDLDDVLHMPMTDADFSRYCLRFGDVLLNEGQSIELVGRCAQYKDQYPEPCAIQNQLVRFRARNGVSAAFSAHLFRHCQQNGVFSKIALQTTSVAHLGVSRFQRLQLAWPPDEVEQDAIGGALDDADALIESLEQLLAKKWNLKHGAMQELLAGQKRLPGFSGEWETKKLSDCLLCRPSYGINAAAVPFSDRLPTYIRITDITEDGRFHPNPPVSVRSAFADQYFLNEGDLVFARTGASVGKSYRYRLEDGPLVYAGFLIRVRPNPGFLLPSYLSSYVATGRYWEWVRLMSMRSGQPGINGNEYAQLPVLLPEIAEQSAISEILNDMDAEIAAIEAKLSKARQIKQGMMQELLTGRIRLV